MPEKQSKQARRICESAPEIGTDYFSPREEAASQKTKQTSQMHLRICNGHR